MLVATTSAPTPAWPVGVPAAIESLRNAQSILDGVPSAYAAADTMDEITVLEKSIIDATKLIRNAQDTAADVKRFGVAKLLGESCDMLGRVSGMSYGTWDIVEHLGPAQGKDAIAVLTSSTWPKVMVGIAQDHNELAIN
jgi:hypothetical protein